ncbi:MAG: glycosyltransferase [Candidatus Riesia sp.]|nr:glycosyltransferase [Candidatus Riesia sp.]
MNSKHAKLIRQYAKKFGEDPKVLKKQFTTLPKKGQLELVEHMKKHINIPDMAIKDTEPVTKVPRHHRLFYGSSYDRGLEHILKLWPKVLAKFPDATLDICYGWNLYDAAFSDNPERQEWKKRIDQQMQQKGITHHGRLGRDELAKVRSRCGIWAYPTHFQEINCITALECQRDGLVPVVMNFAALKETVGSGKRVDGDIYDDEVREEYLNALFEIMGTSSGLWAEESAKAQEFAKGYEWEVIANEWTKQFTDTK